MSPADALVVGAGPVGLTAAIALIRGGLTVDLVEARPSVGSESLAATFHPPTLQILADLGIDLAGHGLEASTIRYRDVAGETWARFDLAELTDETAYPYRRHLPHVVVCRMMLGELERSSRCRIRFGVEADPAVVHDYPWVFAADGADSRQRAAAGVLFPGENYAGTVIRLLCEPTGFDRWDPVTYVFAADTSVSVLRLIDHVRVIVRADDKVTNAETVAISTAERVTGVAPVVRSCSTYRSQRRVIATNLRGNLVFVGDSAHVTTTRGGMNMNSGIHDAAVIATALARDPAGVTAAAAERMTVARELLLPRTHETLEQPAARLQRILEVADDPGARRDFLRRSAMLDMVSWT